MFPFQVFKKSFLISVTYQFKDYILLAAVFAVKNCGHDILKKNIDQKN